MGKNNAILLSNARYKKVYMQHATEMLMKIP